MNIEISNGPMAGTIDERKATQYATRLADGTLHDFRSETEFDAYVNLYLRDPKAAHSSIGPRSIAAPEPFDHCQQNDYVFRTLSDSKNRTEDIVTEMMVNAIIAPNPITGIGSPWCSCPATEEEKQAFRIMCRKMAVKFLWILAESRRIQLKKGIGEGWIPTRSCVDLTTTGAALTRDEEKMILDEVRELWTIDDSQQCRRKKRRKPRKFRICLGCGRRFLAKRANNLTCGPRCQKRVARRKSELEPCPSNLSDPPLKAA